MMRVMASPAESDTIRALAVHPGIARSLHTRRVPRPTLEEITGGRGVLVDVIRVGVDGTGREIIGATYGAAPDGCDYLITGHESLGRIRAVGPNVPPDLRPGGLVVSTVRRPGRSAYDQIGLQDFTLDDDPHERGISFLHGYLCEQYVEDASFVISLPATLEHVGVLLEPMAVVEKGIAQAWEIQRRMRIWQPRRACVIGAGSIGLMAAMQLRLRGLEVVVYSRRKPPYRNSDLVEALGAHYVPSSDIRLAEAAAAHGPFDLIFEASGYAPRTFEAAEALGRNGVLVLASVTGGDQKIEIDANRINEGFVLGNKVMVGTVNAARADFEAGVTDMERAEATWPGWLEQLLTTRIDGLEDPQAVMDHLFDDDAAIKVYVEIAGGAPPS